LLLRDRTDSSQRSIPLESIASLQRSTGVHDHGLQGAAIGFGVGALAGVLVGGAIQPREGTGANASWALGGAVLLGAGGALIGALIGASQRDETWRSMSVHEPNLSGVRIGAARSASPCTSTAAQRCQAQDPGAFPQLVG
jgi:hypothetical protein